MSQSAPAIVWFREDLRLSDNPALHAAVSSGRPLVLLYILDEQTKGLRPLGGASKWWLDKSLRALAADIKQAGAQLTLRSGQSADVLDTVIEETGAETIFWNRRYDQPERDLDAAIKEDLAQRGLDVSSYNARLLNEPWQVETNAGGYYKVFTPYWRAARNNFVARDTYGRHKTLSGPKPERESLDDWGLHPSNPDWSTAFDDWTPGEDGAIARLTDFLDGPINGYKEDRNRPDLDMSTSGLSPHLRFGEIGPLQIWRAVHAGMEAGTIPEKDGHTFLSEIGWREFSHTLLFYNPALASENYNDSFEFMPWQTGWMHNRVRMIVASFLTKHLLLPWQDGEAWFWDTLVDADPANNAASWQWTAGSGADAAPYFRVFNPISQGSKFDETGAYVRRFCPELKDLPDKYLHAPWEASEEILNKSGIQLGKTYPKPIVDHSGARQRALDAYDTLKEKRDAA